MIWICYSRALERRCLGEGRHASFPLSPSFSQLLPYFTISVHAQSMWWKYTLTCWWCKSKWRKAVHRVSDIWSTVLSWWSWPYSRNDHISEQFSTKIWLTIDHITEIKPKRPYIRRPYKRNPVYCLFANFGIFLPPFPISVRTSLMEDPVQRTNYVMVSLRLPTKPTDLYSTNRICSVIALLDEEPFSQPYSGFCQYFKMTVSISNIHVTISDSNCNAIKCVGAHKVFLEVWGFYSLPFIFLAL